MYEVGFTDMLYGNGVCLIEWADLIKDIWPESYKKVTIEKNLDKGFDYRLIIIEENQCKLTK
jgi:tRNA threonylcarbamoyladenosine biosynthesis protein TsaE